MIIASVSSFADALRLYRLLEETQQEELNLTLQHQFADPKSLAKELIQKGWLTPYQANLLLQGRGHELLLGSYLLLERMGEGGMGQVFKARNWKMGRIVALKLIRKERLASPNALRRFKREVQAAAQLIHPNVVLTHDADEVEGCLLLVMEYVEGAIDLSKLIKKQGPLSAAQACEYIRQAALGLQHAHECGMVHRDIKPHNLLLIPGSATVKILDMGLVRLDQSHDTAQDSGTMTQEGAIMGTPDYIAPEQARDPHNTDIRADIYSLGCTLYFLLAGQVPFPGRGMTQKLLKHQLDEPAKLETLHQSIPTELAAIVRKMMAKKPEDRYQTPVEVALALASVFASAGEQTQSIEVGTPRETERKGDTLTTTQEIRQNESSGLLSSSFTMPEGVAEPSQETFNPVFASLSTNVKTIPPEPSAGLPEKAKKRTRFWIKAAVGCGVAVVVIFFLIQFFLPDSETKKGETKIPGKTIPKEEEPNEHEILLTGKWYYIGPFDNANWIGFDTAYPPEQEINLEAVYPGKNKKQVQWREFPNFRISAMLDFLPLFTAFADKEWACLYLYREIEVAKEESIPLFLGSDDTLTVWLNGERLLHRNVQRPLLPDEEFTTLHLKPGKNKLLVKVCQGTGQWGFYISPRKAWFYEQLQFEKWVQEVTALPADKQIEIVKEKIEELNFGFTGPLLTKMEKGEVVALQIQWDHLIDLSPLQGLKKLKKLVCIGTSPQRGRLLDLSPLKGLALEYVNCGYTKVWDLSPLKDMPLKHLYCGGTKVSDFSPVKNMSLKTLWIHDTPITDLSMFKDMPLETVNCKGTMIGDLSLFKDMPLKELICDFKPGRDGEWARSHKTLQKINGKPTKDFWKDVEAQQVAFDKWQQSVVDLPVDEQVEAVIVKLKDLNPKFVGKETSKKENDVVTGLKFMTDFVEDISPVRALRHLNTLECNSSSWINRVKISDLSPLQGLPLTYLSCGRNCVADLSPLKGMSLTFLNCAFSNVKDLSPLQEMPLSELQCQSTQVSDLLPLKKMRLAKLNIAATRVRDLAPLQDLPITHLDCSRNKITDLTPLRSMPLRELICDFHRDRDAEILRSIKTLQKINGKPAKLFWKEVDEKVP